MSYRTPVHSGDSAPDISSVLASLRLSTSPLKQSSRLNWTLCDSEDSLEEALTVTLEGCQCIALDCEGDNLGRKGGKLSMISVRTLPPSVERTILIDVVAFTSSDLKDLFDVIESETILKVVFDGRMDFCAFFYEHGVRMRNVIDLQLADVQSRAAKGQSMKTQNRKLFGYLQPTDVLRNSIMYEKVHMLGGLSSCLKDHNIGASPKGTVDHKIWLRRPLSVTHLSYAAHDVELIGVIYQHFKQRGFIRPQLGEQSSRYITIWSDEQPSDSSILYRSHPLLPLDILTVGSASKRLCGGCQRSLSRNSFPNDHATFCFICLAVQANLKKKGMLRR